MQANAVSDRTLDMRLCDYTGANLSGKVLAGALMSDANLSGTNLQEAVLTKVRPHAFVHACVQPRQEQLGSTCVSDSDDTLTNVP